MADKNKQQEFITTSWPPDIITRDQNRSIQIIVKNNELLDGDAETIKTYAEKVWSERGKVIAEGKNTPSDAATQKKLESRNNKLNKNIKTIYGIALPLPNELIDSQQHEWESTEGLIGKSALGMVGKIESKSGGLVSTTLGNVASSAGFRKMIVNPGYFQDYKGTRPREFTFTWDLIPANATEADSILTILYNLKKYTLPKTTNDGVSLLSPYLFDIKIENKRISNIMNMTNVVCSAMTINYNASGTLQFFADGIPKYIKLDLTFAERTLVTANLF